jgi:tetratricopeptide (TPR) repeat protein
LNIAGIDIATGAESKHIRKNLDLAQFHLKVLYGFIAKATSLIADYVAAELCLRDGALGTAREMIKKCLALSQDISTELALHGLERLSDFSTDMNDIQTTLRWTGTFLGLALKCKDKHQTIHAFRCLGQIYSAKGDDETALSLFKVALDGFTFMDVHHWQADCMVRIADILQDHGEVIKAVGLWKTARPLFERSSQMKDITRIDAKLAEVNPAAPPKNEERPQHLPKLHAPVSAPEETYIAEDDEEEEDQLAQLGNFGDKGQGVLV